MGKGRKQDKSKGGKRQKERQINRGELWPVISYLIKKKHSGSNAFEPPANNNLQGSQEINQIVNDSHLKKKIRLVQEDFPCPI